MRILPGTILIWICLEVWTQQPEPGSRPVGIEDYRIVTDRTIYIAGEEINFRVFNQCSDSLKMINWSKTFYLELISPQGNSQGQEKLPLDNSGAAGTIQVPSDLPSGTYYLKGYTRWMRNYGPASYSYLGVEIVNPYIRSVLPVDTLSEFSIPVIKERSGSNAEGIFSIKMEGITGRRSLMELELQASPNDRPLDLCISVIRQGARESQWTSVPGLTENRWSRIDLLPETRGVSLSGKVEFSESGLPAQFAVVYISELGHEREFYCNYADSTGRFRFAFPDRYGEEELFISADHPEQNELELFIDQDFCTEPILLPSFHLQVDQSNFELISELSENAQITTQYYPQQPKVDNNVPPVSFFYGSPSAVISFDDFIRLPTMEEYFAAVIPQVSIRGPSGRKKLRVLGDHPDLDIYAPLMMIDGVAIPDPGSVLSVSPRNIERIEIVDAPYIRGNITFGGIINLISRNDDLGLINLPESGILINYKMFDPPPRDNRDWHITDKNLPDVRNTLYWDPKMVLAPGMDTTIRFYTSDVKGEYQVVILGYDRGGEYTREVSSFTVE